MLIPHDMMLPTLSFIVLLSLLRSPAVSATDLSTDREYEEILASVLDSLDNSVNYLSSQYRHVNADVVLGLRMAEGQLSVLLKRIENFKLVPPIHQVTFETMRVIHAKMAFLCDVILPELATSDPEQGSYLDKALRRGFWEINSPSRKVDQDLVIEPIVSGEFLNEDTTDECVRELLGTSNKDTPPCSVSDACIKLMTSPGYRMYTLAHQVFYLEVAQQAGCAYETVQRMQENDISVDPDVMMKTFCTNMLTEAEEIATDGFPKEKQDLFMEQGLLCGLDGYRGFFRSDWLQVILNWQDPSGCFKGGYTSDFAHKDDSDSSNNGGVKRRERILKDGCSSHKTAVAVGILSGYLRFILEAMI
ncbi:UPF0764 protein C16orf89 homolog [Ptychodera flava]|uniref:UPF0764 protein C16orf89 homolog n=1 Tax=Ptychodera flava TaxID=63121 RepID=UPI003969F7B9